MSNDSLQQDAIANDKTQREVLPRGTHSIWRWSVGIAMLIALAWVVEWQIGWNHTFAAWQSVPTGTLLFALGLFTFSHLLRALRIFDFVFRDSQARYLQVAKISALHQFANNMLPMRLGEIILPWLTRRHFGVSMAAGLTQLLWLRLLDMGLMGSVLLILVGSKFDPFAYIIVVGIAAFLGLTMIWFVETNFERFPMLVKIREQVIGQAPKNLGVFLRLLLWTALAWFTKLCALAIIVQALADVDVLTALGGALGAELSSLLPIHGVAGSGSFEAAFSAGIAIFGSISRETIAVAVNLHIFVLSSTSMVTLLLLPVKLPRHR